MLSIDEHISQVGRLFYAIAACDGNLHEAELKTLQYAIQEYEDIVKTKYSTEDEKGSSIADLVVQSAIDEKQDSNTQFIKFKNYFELRSEEFCREQKDVILSLAQKIASSYAKKNKSEIVLIAKISLLFNTV